MIAGALTLVMITHAIIEFELHISPAWSSSRTHTGFLLVALMCPLRIGAMMGMGGGRGNGG